ncbi:MAG: hypothetical protein K6G52_03315 [Treponemataceae bacterium]|nr:hypothetical protein [Treponemataceae bacterium]
MKKILICLISIILSSFLFAETFEFTPKINEIYTSREVSLAGNYVADSSTFFSVLANPANAGLTGDKKLFPFFSADMNGSLAEIYDLFRYVSTEDTESLAELLPKLESEPININMSGPICFGSIKNNFAIAFINSTYATGTVDGTDTTAIDAGEQYLLDIAYAYPIKFTEKTILAVGMGLFTFLDMQGSYEGNLVTALEYLSQKSYTFFPIYLSAGFGLDAGITFTTADVFAFGISWRNFFSGAISQKWDSIESLKSFEKKYTVLGNMPLDSNLEFGILINLPLEECTKHFLTVTKIFAQYEQLDELFSLKKNGQTFKASMLYEYLSLGAELEVFHTITFRYGLCNDYMAGGLGLKFDMIHFDASIYSKKIGFTRNDAGSIGFALSFGVYN